MSEMTYCGKDHQDAVGDWWRCGKAEGACPSCLLAHIAKQDTSLSAAQAELATAREVIEESMEARRTSEAEGGALQQANTEIDRLRAELAALRGQVGGVVAGVGFPLDAFDDRMQDLLCWKDDPVRGVVEFNAVNRTVQWFAARVYRAQIPSSRVAGEARQSSIRNTCTGSRESLRMWRRRNWNPAPPRGRDDPR